MMLSARYLTLMTIFLIVLYGCSGGSSPSSPVIPSGSQASTYTSLPIGVSEFDSNGNPLEGYGFLGVFEVNIDPVTLTGTVSSLREASSTDVVEVVDISNFLQIFPCKDCVIIDSIELNSDSNIVVNIGIKHPFPAGNPEKPVTGQNRADLHVFNIEGLVVGNSDTTMVFNGIGATASGFRLMNADGYSPYLDNSLDEIFNTEATIHPYVLHFDDYSSGNYNPSYPMGFQSVTTPPPTGNLVMAMGCDYDVQPYEFNMMTNDSIRFIYAIGCTYGLSADYKAMRMFPEYRVPQHLKKAASEVRIRITDNQLLSGINSSDATIQIDVVDISHGVPTGSLRNNMKADSSVGAITLEIPGIISGFDNVTLSNIGGNGHSPATPLTYEHSFTNEASAESGTYIGLVKVLDTYPVGINETSGLIGNDGIARVDHPQNPIEGAFQIPEFATYQIFTIDVVDYLNEVPICDLQPETTEIWEGGTVSLDATGSYDNDGTIMLYEFDFDWDGVEANFSADESNATGLAVTDSYDIQGSYLAGLRATDNLGAFCYDSTDITVNEWISNCPAAPYAGGTFTTSFAYVRYVLLSLSTDPNWIIHADTIIDSDCLSNGYIVCVYSCHVPDPDTNFFDGSMRIINPSASWQYTIMDGDYPGSRPVSIDIDSTDLVVFVTSTLPSPIDEIQAQAPVRPTTRIAAADTSFKVVDTTIGSASEQSVSVGAKIRAIDIDENDDVWVLDENNVMHKFDKSTNYSEVVAAAFDLDIVSGGAYHGNAYDFVINYYNEALYVLTENTNIAFVDLWRFECDGIYNSSVDGNPNPMLDVLEIPPDHLEYFEGMADITIDNLDSVGDILTGEQDAQIVVAGNIRYGVWDSHGKLCRIGADLDSKIVVEGTGNSEEGLNNIFCWQQGDELWGWQGGRYGDSWVETWSTPADWY